MAGVVSIVVSGDLVLDEPDGAHWLSGIAPAIRAGDLAVGHLEVPHTASLHELHGDVPAPGAPVENLQALAEAGFGLVSLAGNHMADCGPQGIADTMAGLDGVGIGHCGAGANLAQARAAVWRDVGGRRVALLSYNCVGPENGWAGVDSPGVAWLRVETEDGAPIAPSANMVRMDNDVPGVLAADIAAARAQGADLVLVALHKGIVHTPARLAPYERAIAHAAVEAGADVVIGHHAHILRGIEFYRGRPILHGMGNGCVVTRALSPAQDHPARAAWAERRKKLFGFEPDPAYTLAPFHPEAVNAMLARLDWAADGGIALSIIPVHVEAPGRPVLATGEAGARVRRYVEDITVAAGLPPITVADDGAVREKAA
ncbi:CapA family protein [Novosphingobium sp. FSY-8]|uniref:CapA family protein n=1 Tax=Novosphingobium ovatum TaxID=1908523 RepID=A0ABW9XCC3_9SPHN|nr:CapA family protein [Novosphingobium ovatum]NBC36168.1 CapA family protein [Novosphingobium ovatum]